MKRAFSLVELVLTIVLISTIFVVIPKIVLSINKGDSLVIRQDAIFNGLTLTKIVSTLAWDENNTNELSILHTDGSSIFDCNALTNFIRRGGFANSKGRTCNSAKQASSITSDTGEDDYLLFDDFDDFDDFIIDVNNSNNKTKYAIYTNVEYLDDNIFILSGSSMHINLYDASIASTSTNIKQLKTTLEYKGGRGKDKNITSFYYYSSNIGQFSLNKRDWQ